jgi:hypothetical protein
MHIFPRPSVAAFCALTVVSIALGAHARADEAPLVVFRATGPALKPGDRIAGDQRLKLARGESISLIDGDGRMIALNGPYAGSAAEAAAAKTASVTDPLSPLRASASAGTTAIDGPDTTPWLLDTTQGGDFCFDDAADYDLWRPDEGPAETVTIQPADGGTPVPIQFDAHKPRAVLPDALNFVDGAKYRLTRAGRTVEITAHDVPESVPLDRTAAAWFAGVHCERQARALLRGL